MISCPLFDDDFGRAPAPSSQVGGLEAQDVGVSPEQTLDGPAQRAAALSMNDTDSKDAQAPAFFQVFRHQAFNLLGPEGVEVEHPSIGIRTGSSPLISADISQGPEPFLEVFVELGLGGFSLAGLFVYADDPVVQLSGYCRLFIHQILFLSRIIGQVEQLDGRSNGRRDMKKARYSGVKGLLRISLFLPEFMATFFPTWT